MERSINPSGRMIAAEIEVAEASDNFHRIEQVCRKWESGIDEDGSLPDRTGFEIATAPASGDMYVKQIEEICRELSDGSAEVTADCGLHVHVDARDFTYYDIRKLILLYGKIEDTLFEMVPKSRRSSSFCERCAAEYAHYSDRKFIGKETTIRKRITHSVYGKTDVRSERKQQRVQARYRALNLHSWFYRGTVECRMFNGTVDAHKITNWGILWASILDYAYGKMEKEISALSSDGVEILLSIAPTDAVKTFVKEQLEKHASKKPVVLPARPNHCECSACRRLRGEVIES